MTTSSETMRFGVKYSVMYGLNCLDTFHVDEFFWNPFQIAMKFDC